MCRVLIICEGNTCRSPTLVFLLSHVAHRLGHKDDFVSAGFSISASKDERRMRFPARLGLKQALKSVDEALGLPRLDDQDAYLRGVLNDAHRHKSTGLDDHERVHGRFDDFIFITPPKQPDQIKQLLAFKNDLDRLSAPPLDKWRRVFQGDAGWWAWNEAKKRNATKPDRDPDVIEAYESQAKSLGREALAYYGRLPRPPVPRAT